MNQVQFQQGRPMIECMRRRVIEAKSCGTGGRERGGAVSHACVGPRRGLGRVLTVASVLLAMTCLGGCSSMPGAPSNTPAYLRNATLADYPAQVRAMHWRDGELLSQHKPLPFGSWTIRFTGPGLPVATMIYRDQVDNAPPPPRGMVKFTSILMTGLTCSNTVAGTHPCTVVMQRIFMSWMPSSDYWTCRVILGTVRSSATSYSGISAYDGSAFLAMMGCPASVDFAR